MILSIATGRSITTPETISGALDAASSLRALPRSWALTVQPSYGYAWREALDAAERARVDDSADFGAAVCWTKSTDLGHQPVALRLDTYCRIVAAQGEAAA